ncbi:MAG TPA: riboflavin biosynthesis protein RibF [Saprospiraceae bacterium]|nr:riboflavin biosynthesis protein RibF [Saprospiraceae bacterium]
MNIFRGLSALPEFKNSVITIGSYDGVHLGHQKLLKRVQQLAEEINGVDIVITFHPHPREIVFPKDDDLQIITTLNEKLEYFRRYGVSNVVIVPFTIEFSQQSAQEYIEKFLVSRFHPSCIVIGHDHRFGLNRAGDVRLLNMYGVDNNFKVVQIGEEELRDHSISSTRIRNAILENDIELTNELLGHPLMIKGQVVKGNRLGHHIGYPTANVQVTDSKKLLPRDGIFAATAILNGIEYPGMLYIGLRPSIESATQHRVEIHVFDFDKQIYDQEIIIEVYKFIRGDKKFATMEELKEAMEQDEKTVRNFFHNPDKNYPEVATVILNYNGKTFLQRFLPFFTSVRYGNEKLYVVDNASTDGSVKWLKSEYPDVECIPLSQNAGYAGGYNLALPKIKAKYYAIINNDVEITPQWLRPIIKMMEADSNIAAVQPKILSESRRGYFEYAGAAGGMMDSLGYPFCRGRILTTLERDTGQYNDPIQIFWASGAAFVIRSDVFHDTGGFDADYFAHQEEIDLAWRIKLKNFKIVSCPSSVVYHVGGGTLQYDKPQKVYLNFRNNLVTLFKYLPADDVVMVLFIRWLLDGLAGLKYVARGQFGNMFAIVRAHFFIYSHLRSILQKRKNTGLHYKRKPLPYMTGVYPGSILIDYYMRWKRRYSDLFGQ